MIARKWHGRVLAAQADAYYEYLLRTGLHDYRTTPGNRGIIVERWLEGDVAHFLLMTFWDSKEAIMRFAGADYTVPRYYPEDDAYLLEREAIVRHSDVLLSELASKSEVARLAA